jgi:hypothetical protein
LQKPQNAIGRSPYKAYYKAIYVYTNVGGLRPPAFERLSDDGRGDRRTAGAGPPSRSCRTFCNRDARETQRSCFDLGRSENSPRRDQAVFLARRQFFVVCPAESPPAKRRSFGPTGGREAIHRRSEIDRSGGVGKPLRVPCDDVAMSRTRPRPPAGTTR